VNHLPGNNATDDGRYSHGRLRRDAPTVFSKNTCGAAGITRINFPLHLLPGHPIIAEGDNMSTGQSFGGQVVLGKDKEIGHYTAILCGDGATFLGSDHFASDDHRHLSSLEPPIAYLKKIVVDSKRHRRKGHGSRLMEDFIAKARERGARTAFARMSHEETPKEELVQFYRRHQWEVFPDADSAFPRFVVRRLE
jgi:GNAT superfamily N-acetyltransferase